MGESTGLKNIVTHGFPYSIPFSSFERPSAIQQRAIVPFVKGHDVIAQAQSGTGKTATFSISILQQVKSSFPPNQFLKTDVAILAGCICQSHAGLDTRPHS